MNIADNRRVERDGATGGRGDWRDRQTEDRHHHRGQGLHH